MRTGFCNRNKGVHLSTASILKLKSRNYFNLDKSKLIHP
jgi:hypothetical protein